MTGPVKIAGQNIALKEAPKVLPQGEAASEKIETDISINCECDSVTIKEDNAGKRQEESKSILQNITDGIKTTVVNGVTGAFMGSLGFSVTVFKMVGAFSPLIDFIDSLTGTDKKKTIKDLNDILQNIQAKIANDKNLSESISPESKEAIKKLVNSVSELNKNKDLQNMDISGLINKWRQAGDHNALLQLADKIRNKECAQFTDEGLREQFVEGLESLGQALAELSGQPDSRAKREVHGELKKAADKVVDNVEIHNTRGGDTNFTLEDKEKIKDNFNDAGKHIINVAENPKSASLMPNLFSRLFSWVTSLYDFLQEWFEAKEEEKEKEEKLCEERCEQKKKYYEVKHREEVAKKKEMYFKALMREMLEKIRYAKMNQFEKETVNRTYDYAKNNSASEAYKADYYESKKCEIVESMLPSYVCQDGFTLDLDITC